MIVRLFSPARGIADENNTITVESVSKKIESHEDVLLLDVRTEAEYNGPLGHLKDAKLIPINELENRLSELEAYKEKEIIVYCRSGNRSNTGMKILREKGFKAYNMLGGMKAYRKYEEKIEK